MLIPFEQNLLEWNSAVVAASSGEYFDWLLEAMPIVKISMSDNLALLIENF